MQYVLTMYVNSSFLARVHCVWHICGIIAICIAHCEDAKCSGSHTVRVHNHFLAVDFYSK